MGPNMMGHLSIASFILAQQRAIFAQNNYSFWDLDSKEATVVQYVDNFQVTMFYEFLAANSIWRYNLHA
jgi:hypothetical protein